MTDREPATALLWLQDQHDAADRRASAWRIVGLVAASALWAFPSLFVWLLLVVGLFGWSAESSATDGVLSGSTGGLPALLWGALIEVGVAAALVGIARWALGPTRVAVAVGLLATVWVQALVSVGVLVLT
jgi:hypothetical protein